MREFQAIWDTGATGVVISQAIIETCGLTHTGFADSYHVGSDEPNRVRTFLVNLELPNQVRCNGIAIEGHTLSADMLIGMAIIGLGDFAITHPGGKTKFTFRIPPQADINFVEEDRPGNQRERMRNLAAAKRTNPPRSSRGKRNPGRR